MTASRLTNVGFIILIVGILIDTFAQRLPELIPTVIIITGAVLSLSGLFSSMRKGSDGKKR